MSSSSPPLQPMQDRIQVLTEAVRVAETRATAGQVALEVMHEVRNPLEALSSLVYLAGQAAATDDTGRVLEYIQLAEEQIITLGQITSWTLGLASSSRIPRPSDLASLTEAALRIHRRTIESKKVRLIKSLPPTLPVEGNTGSLLLVISNLITNALDAVPPQGVLWIRLRKCTGKARIVVADNGHGIPREHLNSIFEPFFTTKGERGTGLGLALSKKIVEQHRGSIRIRSSTHGLRCGTIFQVSIPN